MRLSPRCSSLSGRLGVLLALPLRIMVGTSI
jgi:hypothetical protein